VKLTQLRVDFILHFCEQKAGNLLGTKHRFLPEIVLQEPSQKVF